MLYNSVPIPRKAELIFRVHLGQACSNSWVRLSQLVDLKSLAKEAGIYCTSLSLLNWKECNSQHITAPSHGFFPGTEQKYVLNISALSMVLCPTVLTGYILFLMYLKSSFLSLKRPAMSLATAFSLCLSTLSRAPELHVLFLTSFYSFFFLKHFALRSVCSISLHRAGHFGWHRIGGRNFFEPFSAQGEWLYSLCTTWPSWDLKDDAAGVWRELGN